MWKILNVLSLISLIIPKPIFIIVWRLLDVFDGRFGATLRYILISKKLKKCGIKVYIGPNVTVIDIKNLEIGNNVSIHHQCTIISNGGIKINDNVAIAHNSSLVSTNHTWENKKIPIKYNPVTKSSITIKSDVWIGCGVRVLAGSFIDSRSIIAAGAVVAGNTLDSHSIYGGIPCKKIKNLQ